MSWEGQNPKWSHTWVSMCKEYCEPHDTWPLTRWAESASAASKIQDKPELQTCSRYVQQWPVKSRKSLGDEPLNVKCWCTDYICVHAVFSSSTTGLQRLRVHVWGVFPGIQPATPVLDQLAQYSTRPKWMHPNSLPPSHSPRYVVSQLLWLLSSVEEVFPVMQNSNEHETNHNAKPLLCWHHFQSLSPS